MLVPVLVVIDDGVLLVNAAGLGDTEDSGGPQLGKTQEAEAPPAGGPNLPPQLPRPPVGLGVECVCGESPPGRTQPAGCGFAYMPRLAPPTPSGSTHLIRLRPPHPAPPTPLRPSWPLPLWPPLQSTLPSWGLLLGQLWGLGMCWPSRTDAHSLGQAGSVKGRGCRESPPTPGQPASPTGAHTTSPSDGTGTHAWMTRSTPPCPTHMHTHRYVHPEPGYPGYPPGGQSPSSLTGSS